MANGGSGEVREAGVSEDVCRECGVLDSSEAGLGVALGGLANEGEGEGIGLCDGCMESAVPTALKPLDL